MPYVDRNTRGKIVAVFARPQRNGHEALRPDDTEVEAFVQRRTISAAKRKEKLKELGDVCRAGTATTDEIREALGMLLP